MVISKFFLFLICLATFDGAFCLRPGLASSFRSLNKDAYNYYWHQRLKQDVFSIFNLGREMSKQAKPANGNDYRQVSQRAGKIQKLARRIKAALTMGNSSNENGNGRAASGEVLSHQMLHREILQINTLVHRIRIGYAKLGRHVLDARLQSELYKTVETLESLALHVKEEAEGLAQQD